MSPERNPDLHQQRIFSRIEAPQLTFEKGDPSDPQLSAIGWYVQAVDRDTRSSARLAKPKKITPAGALLIAQAFDQALSMTLGQPVDYFEVGVRQQNDHARDMIKETAGAAELRAELLTMQLTEEARRRSADLIAWDVAPPATITEQALGSKHAVANR